VPSRAEDSSARFYAGAAYEAGMMQFKDGSPYAENISGFSPLIGVTLSKHFALEGAWSWYSGQRDASNNLSYRSSGNGLTTDLLINLPVGDTGISPFFGFGVSIMKFKETTLTITDDPQTHKQTKTFATLVTKSEVFPVGTVGLSYTYGGIEIRASAKAQPINVGNAGQYMVTYGGGLLFHL
jgi:hypothetical protein